MKHNWEYKRLGSFLKTTSGGTPLKGVSKYYDNGTIPWLRSGEVCKKEILDCEIYITQKAVDESSAKFIPANSVVMAMYGATAGQVGIIRQVMTTNQAICSIFPSPFYSQDFLYYYLSSLKDKLVEQAYGAAQPNISQTIIKSLYIPVPQMKTQDQIVAELDQINDLIAKNRELLSQLDALAQSLFYDTFGDPISNPKGWGAKRFKDILCKIGSGATPRGGKQSYQGGEVSLIRSLNVYNTYFKYDELAKINDEQAYELRNVEVLNYDVLLNITGASVARCFIVPVDTLPARVNQHVAILRPNNKYIQSIYLHRLLITPTFQNYLIGTARGKSATREALPKATLEMIEIPVPPLDLQEDFAAKVEAIEAQKAKVEAEIAELQTLLDARMDYWFN